MSEISFNFHKMESICEELALLSELFTKQVLSPLNDAYSALDPEITDKVQPRFHAVLERAVRFRGEQHNLAAFIEDASGTYKKYDREAAGNLASINEHTHRLMDGLQRELRGVTKGHTTPPPSSFTVTPDGYSRDVPHAPLRALGEVAAFTVEKDTVNYSFISPASSENQIATYEAVSSLHDFSLPRYDFHAKGMTENVTDSAYPAGKIIFPAIVAAGIGGAFIALNLQTGGSTGMQSKRISGKSLAGDNRVKTTAKWFSKGALAASMLAGGLAVLKKHSNISFAASEKRDISSRNGLFDEDTAGGLPVRTGERRIIYDYLNALGLFMFNIIALPKFIYIENFRIMVDTVSRDIFLKEYYRHIRNQNLDVNTFAANKSAAVPVSANVISKDELGVLNLNKKIDLQVAASHIEADEANPVIVSKVADPYIAAASRNEADELTPFVADGGIEPQIAVPSRNETGELTPFVVAEGIDPHITASRKEAYELTPFIFNEGIDPHIVIPASYNTEPLLSVIFPDPDNIPWNFSLKYNPGFTTWMERFDIRVRILPPDYGYIREFTPVAGEDNPVLSKDIIAEGKLAGLRPQENEDADVTGNTSRVGVRALDRFEIIGETFDILWKHIIHRDSDISEPHIKKDWGEILGGKFFSDAELDAGNTYERRLYDSVFAFLVKHMYIPEIERLDLFGTPHTSPTMNKVAMEDIESPAYAGNAVGGPSSVKRSADGETTQAYSAPKAGNQVFASRSVNTVSSPEHVEVINAGAGGFLNVTSKRVDAAELTPNKVLENMNGPSRFGVNTIQASNIAAEDNGEVWPVMAKASGARVNVSEGNLTSQFSQWSVTFTGNTFKSQDLLYAQSAAAYLGAKTGAKATDERDIDPVNGNSANSVIVNAKKNKNMSLDAADVGKDGSTELTDKQIEVLLSVLAGATIGTGLVFAAKKAAGALSNGGTYSLPDNVSFESLQKSAVSITGEMLTSLTKYGLELGSLATLVDTVCKSVWTQGSAVSAVLTYSSVALLTAQKMYNIYKR